MTRVVGWTAAASGMLLIATTAHAQHLDRDSFPSEAVYELHRTSAVFRTCDLNRDGAFQPDELVCYEARRASRDTPLISAVPKESVMQAAIPIEAASADDEEKCPQGHLLIRRSRDDIGSFADPTCFSDATGAEFAWADNRIEENEVWSARGIVAMPFVGHGTFKLDEPYIDTVVVAPYVNFDRVVNTKDVTNDVDNLTYGGVFEASVANVLNATHYFNVSGEAVSSFAGDAKNWSIDLEWHPVGGLSSEGANPLFSYFGTPLPLGRYFVFSINPSLQAEYVAELGEVSTQPIFAEHDEALRVGPSVLLTVDGKGLPHVPWWIQRIHYQIAYGWLYDLLSSKDYELVDTALKLSLDEAGHLGLTFSYRKGQLVATGQDVDLANIALSVSY